MFISAYWILPVMKVSPVTVNKKFGSSSCFYVAPMIFKKYFLTGENGPLYKVSSCQDA